MAARNPEVAHAMQQAIRSSTMSQGEIAEALGVAQATVSRWANGSASPATAYWPRIVEKLGIDLSSRAGAVSQQLVADQIAELQELVKSHWDVIQKQGEQLVALTQRVTEMDVGAGQGKRVGQPAADHSQ